MLVKLHTPVTQVANKRTTLDQIFNTIATAHSNCLLNPQHTCWRSVRPLLLPQHSKAPPTSGPHHRRTAHSSFYSLVDKVARHILLQQWTNNQVINSYSSLPTPYLWSVSLRAWASLNPVYIQTRPGPPSHLRPISINTRWPVFPVLLILSLSQETSGVEGSAGL